MSIIYLIAGTFNAGGMERVLTQKANWLVRNGYEVTIVTTDQRGRKPYFPLDDRIQTYDLGINYDADNGHMWSKLVHYPIRQRKHKRRLSALLMRLHADVVICMFNNDVSFVYKIKDGSRKILEIHFSKNKKLQYGRHGLWALADRWRTWQEERIVREYDRFIVLTHEDRQLWGDLPNICVIPNAITGKPIQRATLTHKRVLAVGRLDWQKGFDTLLNIWKEINEDDTLRYEDANLNPNLNGNENEDVNENEDGNPNLNENANENEDKKSGGTGLTECQNGWKLDVIGDGPLREALQEQVARLGLQDSVRLLRPTDNIQRAYLNASILVMTSRYEGLPMVLLEAQACGLPIVAFACQCGPRDVIHDGIDGYLIENRDEKRFADCLLKLMDNEALRQQMGAAAVTSSNAFAEDRVMASWEKVFEEGLNSHRSHRFH